MNTDTKDKSMTGLSEEETHNVGHLRHQVERATPDNPDVAFDYTLGASLLHIIDRLTTPPAPKAGEIERQVKIHSGVYDTNPETASEFPHGPIIEVDGSLIYFDLYQEKLAEEVLATLRSAQTPARTYADGIEDAAKVTENSGGPHTPIPNTRAGIAAAIRALATKPAHVSGKEDDNA